MTERRIFVIHEHFAKKHHFDLRLEINGVLKSWAIPKDIPLKPGEKRLAVEVNDHPVEYARFEGEIPKGTYGAGKVSIWDSGHFLLLKKSNKGIEVDIRGKKLRGRYVLLLFREEKGKKNWLLFKKHEANQYN
ncbi:MAG TPA: DNA polymerase ligase N-terminal domain-containing protein [Candidatus Ratteibacteria bacterium]|jgi:DNA ligase D-like protein (predicted 3'-phosphoesterase)|uniref:DNA ligase-like protein n=1 Tax=candidate division TA06 bacterium ADurb.Bin131 TaxID=1852827 RepID=A0A1V6CC29_UNCT6|nr:MAG: putative DNA ligase-like protein [candidate division TA06 bacterium ADurb.Bin131]HOC02991.1 DNA polymerase ligase N-terminal domain-containing protein [bacterium]HRS06568.1 DNA polymerase ligase N-terminal domain-containing protein [Candidatus Ratteibacteria bacterium]HON05598.1 DNA polymerase ligase N-terminal domain-containing protein [bacterium]HPC30056.1 DNA polymerase ligase N-terminal domain-containing protein [bacterium]